MVSAILYITLKLINCSGLGFGLGLECHGLGLGFGLAVCGLGLLAMASCLMALALALDCVTLLTSLDQRRPMDLCGSGRTLILSFSLAFSVNGGFWKNR